MKQAISTAEIFHEATKYTPLGIQLRTSPPNLDDQPSLYKDYPGYKRIELGTNSRQNVQLEARDSKSWTQKEIAQLLFLTNGVTGVLEYPAAEPYEEPEQIRLRAAPSAGGLYPTELYVALGDGHEVDAGLYNYHVGNHELAQLEARNVIPAFAQNSQCQEFLEQTSMVLILSIIFERSAWRYEDRAYRRVLLDTGHVLGNLVLVAERLGRKALPMGAFCDDTVTSQLFFDHHYEGAVLLIPIVTNDQAQNLPTKLRALPSDVESKRKVPNTSLMRRLHASSGLTPPLAPAPSFEVPKEMDRLLQDHFVETVALEPVPTDWVEQLTETIVRRRSTREFTGDAFAKTDLSAFLYAGAETPGLLVSDLIETYVFVHNVTDIEAGAYQFFPENQCLKLIRAGDFKEAAGQFCLGQELGSDGAAIVLHVAHLPRAVTRFGNRAYRYLHLDAGHIGQRMNLCAIKRSLGVSGIGGFFDDMINETLGLSPSYATLYITCLGVPE
ncbi:MAG: SagB/ThcOx family dehydrogenase [Planctomycetota bacterium]|nr:SagB/ThcOx family dehydrogenase [Planctomycetota bacterium]